jgi:hypothetical protein
MIAPLLALAAAGAAPAELPGVWEGTIGNLPVRACFVRTEWSSFGAYYYLSRRQLIALSAEERREGGFLEGNGAPADQPRWLIESASGGRLAGRWTSGARTLPVRLSRVAATAGEEGPCGSLAFHQPRLEGVRVVRTRAAQDGVAYTKLALDPAGRFEVSLETFALDGESDAVRRINAALGQGLTGNPPAWFQCIQDSLAQSAFEGSFAESLAPAMISRRWLSVATHWDGFCGGAHPSSSNGWRLFDLTSGAEVDPNDWLNDAAVERHGTAGSDEDYATVQPALRDAILAGWRPEDAECGETIRSAEIWNIGLARDSVTFSPSLPHVAQACGEDFTLPFARLTPFLTPEGAANLRALQSE